MCRFALCVLILVPCAVRAEDKEFSRLPSQWELGQVGTFPEGKYHFEVKEVLGPDEFQAIGVDGILLWIEPFIVRGMSTKGFVSEKIVNLDGKFKVIDTKKLGGKTFFVLEPVKVKR